MTTDRTETPRDSEDDSTQLRAIIASVEALSAPAIAAEARVTDERESVAVAQALEQAAKEALSDITQIYGLLQEGEYDKADDYCRCAAERYTRPEFIADIAIEARRQKEDAERYRFERERDYQRSLDSFEHTTFDEDMVHISESEFNVWYDSAIDAARKQAP